MRNISNRYMCAFCAVVLTVAFVQADDQPDSVPGMNDRPIGWASVEGGTTGGQGGEVVTVSDAESFALAIRGNDPRIVLVSGTIRLPELGRVGSNKTILGERADAKIEGGLRLVRVSNVIIRNLAITGSPDDAIDIESSDHVWVDHCDLSNCDDGLVDVKRGSDFVTVSWNHFRDHHKTTLVGHSDKSDIREIDLGHLRVTYHHNFFDGTFSRHPRVRFGETVHVFNNYYLGNDHGAHSAMDAGVLVEGNYFEKVRYPTDTEFGASPEPGRLVERNNIFDNCANEPSVRGEVKEIGDAYSYELDDPADLRAIIKQGVGVGKLAADE